LFETDFISGNIYEFATDGTRSTFASGLSAPSGLAFQGEILPVPEPTTACLMIFGAAGMLFLRKKVLVNPPADVEKRKFGKRKLATREHKDHRELFLRSLRSFAANESVSISVHPWLEFCALSQLKFQLRREH